MFCGESEIGLPPSRGLTLKARTMKHVRKFFSGGMVVVLISGVSAGCAGNGLKGMFSRDETSGYKTLEELEAERVAKEASDEEGGSRFASWLPFGKSDAERAEEVASSSAEDLEDEKQVSSLWRNPFRRQETVESDPFLSKESPEAEIVGDKSKTAAVEASASRGKEKEEVAGNLKKESPKDAPVKTASSTAAADKPEQDDELVDRFEKHFVQKTATPGDDEEQAAPLIASSKDVKKAAAKASGKETRPSDARGEDQLLEFEKLITEKKALATQKKNSAKAAVHDAADDFADSLLAEGAADEKASAESGEEERSEKSVADGAVDSFDSLLASADSERLEKAGPSKSRARTVKPVVAQDIEVADQEGLFGPDVKSAANREESFDADVANNAWPSPSTRADRFAWPDPKTGTQTARNAAARTITKSDEDQFASMFSDARDQETPPAATLPDSPEAGAWPSASNARPAGISRRGKMNNVSAVSSGRIVAGHAPVAATSPLEPVTPVVIRTSSESQVAQADQFADSEHETVSALAVDVPTVGRGLTIRMLVLLVGGIIVVALLFAPSRKKPIHANQMPIQG